VLVRQESELSTVNIFALINLQFKKTEKSRRGEDEKVSIPE
jgi:hypothetical protein